MEVVGRTGTPFQDIAAGRGRSSMAAVVIVEAGREDEGLAVFWIFG